MQKKRIYLCGKITGMAWGTARAKFEAVEKNFEKEFEVVNPIKLCYPETDWHKCMNKDFSELITCDAIYVMNNWQQSKGARIEVAVAQELMPENMIFFEPF